MGKVISKAGTKGGILKSTLTQCISTSKAFQKYKVIILEGDSQNSLTSWMEERDANLKPLNITIINHNKERELKDEITEYKEQCDFLFVDLPGESEALTLTRTALAYSDLCIFPLRLSHKDTTAFDKNMRQPLKKILEIRDKKHFRILPIFAHHSTKIESFRQNYEAIGIIDTFHNVHRDRNVYTYFSVGGLSLYEYQEQHKKGSDEFEKTQKAINDIELIAQEILQTL
jgi:cellulose biosynthesis protein BcsQ